MNDLNILRGTIVQPEGCFKGSIEISRGKIVRINKNDDPREPAFEMIDASGLLIFPGMIDSHVHIRGGKLSYREDFASGTMAAAAGGVTTIVEMPVSNPPASREEAFDARLEEVARQAYVDFALYGGAGADNLSEIPKLAEHGAAAYKTFLMPPVPGREAEFYGLCSETQETLCKVMEQVAKTGRLLAVHSELNQYVQAETQRRMAAGENGLRSFCHSRPVEAETEAVKWVISAAEQTGCKASVCHVSTPEAAGLIREAQRKGIPVYGETCPQYLLFNEDNAEKAGVFARMKPPLRDAGRMTELRKMYREGVFDLTGSDHAPYLREEKLKNGQDIWNTFDGTCGLELSLLLLLNAVEDGSMTWEAIARNTAENPAKLLGLSSKGRIAPGYDADLVILKRREAPEPLDITKMFTKSRDSAELYSGIPMHYKIYKTFVRGTQVYDNGQITGKQGYGNFISPV